MDATDGPGWQAQSGVHDAWTGLMYLFTIWAPQQVANIGTLQNMIARTG